MVDVHEHVGALVDEDIQGPGTRAWLFALVAVVGGTLAVLVFGDAFGVGPVMTGLVAGAAAGLFGVFAGLAGSAQPRRELERLGHAVAAGRALVTVDVDSKRASEPLQAELLRSGALRTGVLYGPGLGSVRIRPRPKTEPETEPALGTDPAGPDPTD